MIPSHPKLLGTHKNVCAMLCLATEGRESSHISWRMLRANETDPHHAAGQEVEGACCKSGL